MITIPKILRSFVAFILISLEMNAVKYGWSDSLHVPIVLALMYWIFYLSFTGPKRYFHKE